MAEPVRTKRVITVGNFDGVHLGHAELVSRARAMADRLGVGVTAVVFDPHPISVLRPGAEPARLTTFTERSARLRALGVDDVERLEPTRSLLDTPPRAFIEHLHRRLGMAGMVEGPDFRFGHARAGDVELLATLATDIGFAFECVSETVRADLDDQSVVIASSTVIRWLVSHGRVRDAARVMGRPYRVSGIVSQGDRRGRTIGFPTANVGAETAIPQDGVYACLGVLPDGRRVPAAVNIGSRPTFDGRERRVEAHLLLDGPADRWSPIDGLEEYGWRLDLDFVGRVRDQVRFEGIDALAAQLRRDVDRVRMMTGRGTARGERPTEPTGAR